MLIPKRNYQRWDGYEKFKTENCESCDYYRKIKQDEICGWGEAFKILAHSNKKRKCEVKDREIQHTPSIEYVDEMIKKNKIPLELSIQAGERD